MANPKMIAVGNEQLVCDGLSLQQVLEIMKQQMDQILVDMRGTSKWINHFGFRGQDIDGEAGEDTSGNSVSINHDGTLLAIGAPGNDGAGPNAGHVRLYGWSDSTSSWIREVQRISMEIRQRAMIPWSLILMEMLQTAVVKRAVGPQISQTWNYSSCSCMENDDSGENAGTTREFGWDEPSQLWVQGLVILMERLPGITVVIRQQLVQMDLSLQLRLGVILEPVDISKILMMMVMVLMIMLMLFLLILMNH